MNFDDEVQRLQFYLKDCEEENKKLREKVEQLEKTNRKLNHEIGGYSGKIGSIAEKLLLLEREMLKA